MTTTTTTSTSSVTHEASPPKSARTLCTHSHTLSRSHARTHATHTRARCAAFRGASAVDCRLFLPLVVVVVVAGCSLSVFSLAIAVFSSSVAVRNILHRRTRPRFSNSELANRRKIRFFFRTTCDDLDFTRLRARAQRQGGIFAIG